MFKLTMFPAHDGDCLLLSWGHEAPYKHILIDGGRSSAYKFLKPRLEQIAEAGEKLSLFVLTHIDADHIEGTLKLAKDDELPLVPEQVWYNGFPQLKTIEAMGPKQGDEYSKLLAELKWPLNTVTEGGPICVEELPDEIEIEDLRIRIISPTKAKLSDLATVWTRWRTEEAAKAERARLKKVAGVEVMGRKPIDLPIVVEKLVEPTPIDDEPPNGSSIAFTAEWDGRRILLTGDAHPDVLESEIKKAHGDERLAVDLLKVSHHGSAGNTTAGLVKALDCIRFAISTSGSRHGHPDPEAIARLLAFSPGGTKTLYFTHKTKKTEPWDEAKLKAKYDFRCVFAGEGEPISIDLDALDQ